MEGGAVVLFGQLSIGEVGALVGLASVVSGVGAGLAANKLSLRFFGAGLAETKETVRLLMKKHDGDMERFSKRLYFDDGMTVFVPRSECLICKKFSESQFLEVKGMLAERSAQFKHISDQLAALLARAAGADAKI